MTQTTEPTAASTSTSGHRSYRPLLHVLAIAFGIGGLMLLAFAIGAAVGVHRERAAAAKADNYVDGAGWHYLNTPNLYGYPTTVDGRNYVCFSNLKPGAEQTLSCVADAGAR